MVNMVLKGKIYITPEKVEDTVSTLKDRLFVHLLVGLFGMGPWVAASSIMLQSAVLIQTAPEGWKLSSYVGVIAQFACIGPLGYALIQKYSPKKMNDSYVIFGVFALGVAGTILAMFAVHKTVVIAGHEVSLPFFLVVFLLDLMGFTSHVVCMPYMGRFLEAYMLTFIVGESLGGFFPSMLALAQGVGGKVQCIKTNNTDGPEYERYAPPPNFSSEYFFIFGLVCLFVGLVSFILLEKLPVCDIARAKVNISAGNDYQYHSEEKTKNGKTVKILSSLYWRLLLFIIFLKSFLAMGIMGSLSTYVYLPYGHETYHLVMTISLASMPISVIISIFLKSKSVRLVIGLTIFSFLIGGYSMTVAFTNPNPPLVGTKIGQILIICCGALKIWLANYVRICIVTIMRDQGGRSLVWTGTVSQIGRTIGTVAGFCIVNFGNFLQSTDEC